MHPDVGKHLNKLIELVECGKLPETAIPRLFWNGHQLLHIYGKPFNEKEVKCIDCDKVLIGVKESCPDCNSKNIFITNEDRIGQWRCYNCKHEWKGECGETCPSCDAKSNVVL